MLTVLSFITAGTSNDLGPHLFTLLFLISSCWSLFRMASLNQSINIVFALCYLSKYKLTDANELRYMSAKNNAPILVQIIKMSHISSRYSSPRRL